MSNEPIYVVGGGLVGALTAIVLARRGHRVALYERRPDMRRATIAAGRSINLVLTSRGLKALAEVGLREEALAITIPCKGRMLHDREGNTSFVPYGQKPDEVIYSISRGDLNKLLLTTAESYENVTLHFEHRCTGYDVASKTLHMHDEATGKDLHLAAPVTIGTDGYASVLREAVAAHAPGFSKTEDRHEYGYKELIIPATASGDYPIEKHALHIWPRGDFMLMALPNLGGSFTVTLFFAHEGEQSFAKLTSEAAVKEFFTTTFPDAEKLMPNLAEVFFANPTGAMVTVRCAPWHIGGQLMLMGDAAHAIVPFYGQGMNCGFEDASALGALLDAHAGDWTRIFPALTTERKPNADAIAALALENFIEMRATTADPKFQLKKQIGFALEARYPGRFIARYAMVVFHPEIPYAEARSRGIAQDAMLEQLAANITRVDDVDWSLAETLMGETKAA